jgi:uncharacterized repeat protein (TIGR03847 family)
MEISFDEVERFVVGTVGLPGEREFYLQVSHQGRQVSFALEKSQAMALAQRMSELLREIRRLKNPVDQERDTLIERDDGPLSSPIESEFNLGEMSLMWVDESSQIVFESSGREESNADSVVVYLTIGQAKEFVRRTESVVSAGRSPCPFCGLPLNLDGHLCPRANGYRR